MDLLISFSVLSGLLLVGTFIRAKVTFIQSVFLPASVIGGFVGLLLGPILWGTYAPLPIPQDWMDIYALLPGILIVPVVATVPLGIRFKQKNKDTQNASTTNSQEKKKMNTGMNMLVMFLVLVFISQGQQLLGLVIRYVLEKLGLLGDVYATFGTEVEAGFSGGHGTAGVIGSLLKSMNLPYWEVAQGLTVTSATVGIVGGILIGVMMINYAARKGYTNYLLGPGKFPKEERIGVQRDPYQQNSFGKETTLSSSIDVLTFHTALILGGSGLAYGLLSLVKYFNVPFISNVPIWAYAIVVMYGVWGMMCLLKLDWLVDRQVKSKIASLFTDYAVVAAIASLPIQSALAYIVPFIIMIVVIGGLTLAGAYWLSKKLFDEYWFEKGIAIFGTSTGVFISGLLLLKMCDPSFKSPVLSEFSMGYSFNLVVGFIMFPIMFGFLVHQGLWAGILLLAGVCFIAVIGLLGARHIHNSE
ncbi:hypothetical protein FH966_01935 [Lentibacillus cibarius]|uniref:Sodium:glutamate symporter n=1 Tax=Lentibacillus cibarius TaxID=2583219 RepID=A0A549YFE8_9BACI|nr:hypothetical protein [Lentibacillus cibarius]TMN21695.1 hypothetical protein FFL34_05890 [Lentibacillus cibarius]TRM10578.1 hypothetical protein FH966_01935 [Lentibacillus cibarius]